MSKYITILLSFLALTSYAQIEIPAHSSSDQIVKHKYFTLKYNEENEQADWVAYRLSSDMLLGKTQRSNNFRPDPAVTTGSADSSDYSNSGYDRGHLCPAGDMKVSSEAMSETFYYSNMSPQTASFNRGIWENLEEKVRDWAVQNDEIYVVTGPVLAQGIEGKIGKDGVSVPKYYFKVILDDKEPELKAIAFILPNEGSKEPLAKFAVSVDQAEKFTGFDFFPTLPDDIEEKLESELDMSKWGMREPPSRYIPKTAETMKTTPPIPAKTPETVVTPDKTVAKPKSQEASQTNKVQSKVDIDKDSLPFVVIIVVILVIGVLVLVVGVKINKRGK